jgi:2-polyprenyl-3-methyl-5-hydroxy-6-metoxy-1,4-benzoquinol methylase
VFTRIDRANTAPARVHDYRALTDGPLTSAELAGRTGTVERYAREWLEQQAVTGLLETDPALDAACRRYTRPDAYVAPLTDGLDLSHLAPLAQAMIGFVKQTDRMVEAFRTGGSVSWAEHGPDAREGQAAANRPLFLGPLGREYLPSIPDVDAALRAGGCVADVGCGLGWSSIGIAPAYPDATVDGYDLDLPSIATARRNAREAGVGDRVRSHAVDAAIVDEPVYDAVFA